MATRTRFQTIRSWALPLAIGIVIGGVGVQLVQAQAPAPKATRLLQADLTGVPGKEVFMTILDEFVFVIEGSYERFVEQMSRSFLPSTLSIKASRWWNA
jgi:hypothetical protein